MSELPCMEPCFQGLVDIGDEFGDAMDELAVAERTEMHLDIAIVSEQERKDIRSNRARRLTLLEANKCLISIK